MAVVKRSLRNVRQRQAVRAFVRLGGIELRGRGKGSHKLVRMPNGHTLTIPGGTLNVWLLRGVLKDADVAEGKFLEAL